MSVDVSDAIYVLAEGRYAVFEPLGEGGSATVHRARDLQLGAERAIKLRRVPAGARESDSVQRLVDEARVMARVSHRHILPVYDVGWDKGWQYVVMHLAVGGSVDGRVADDGPYPPRHAVDLVLPVLDALQAAHEAGVLHRDLKPHNILLDAEDTPLLADWGIARLDDRDATLTRTGVAMGTFAYMAPEQRLDAHEVGATADVYAAGATLYHLITAGSPVDLFHAAPSSPRWAEVPEALRAVLQQACAHDPTSRPPTAAAFADALRAVRDDLSTRVSRLHGRSRAAGGGTADGGTVGGGTADGGTVDGGTVDGGTADGGTVGAREAASLDVDRAAPTDAEASRAARGRSRSVWVLGVLGLGGVGGIGLVLLAFARSTAPPEVVVRAPEGSAALETDAPGAEPEPPPARVDGPAGISEPSGVARGRGPERGVGSQPGAPPLAEGSPDTMPAGGSAAASAVSEPPPQAEGPPLPIHGRWRGSLGGRVATLQIDGPSNALRVRLRVGDAEHRGRGRFDASAGLLAATLAGPGPGAGRWELRLSGDRLRGTYTLAGTTDVRGASFRRR